MRIDGNDRVAEFIRSLNWNALPDAVQRQARLCLLDALGAMLAGTLTRASQIAAETAASLWRGEDATIFLQGLRARAAGAAFANASAASGLDIDDDAIFACGHSGAQIIPTALAVGEELNASGKALLEALVVGYEIAVRAALCWHADHEGIQSSGSWGSLACAAVAARLRGLDHGQVKHALGIADYHAPNAPQVRQMRNPAMVKHAADWGAMNGVVSAELAQRGFTGIPSLFGNMDYHEWVQDIGEKFWIASGVYHKRWACCTWGQAACQAASQLIQAHDIYAGQVANVQVHTFEDALKLSQDYPKTTEEAQASLRWPLACLLLDGEVGPAQVLEKRLGDPQVLALFDKIELVLDPEVDILRRQASLMDPTMYSAVTITLTDGRRFASGVVGNHPDVYDQPMLEDKFRRLAGFVLLPERLEALIDQVRHIEDLGSVRKIAHLIAR